jgi:hypothetical protein
MRAEEVDDLREGAASFRELARRARTSDGSSALKAIAEQCDEDARRIDPLSERRWTS